MASDNVGLQIWDANGKLLIDDTTRFGKIIGVVNLVDLTRDNVKSSISFSIPQGRQVLVLPCAPRSRLNGEKARRIVNYKYPNATEAEKQKMTDDLFYTDIGCLTIWGIAQGFAANFSVTTNSPTNYTISWGAYPFQGDGKEATSDEVYAFYTKPAHNMFPYGPNETDAYSLDDAIDWAIAYGYY